MHRTASADPVSISVSAPANVVIGSTFAYSIVVTYNGDLSGPSPEYTFTAALPSLVAYQGLAGPFPASCPTTPQSGQVSGTVVCTFGFSPDMKTITIPIEVRAATTGSATASAQLSTGPSAAATTSIDPVPAASITLSMTGPPTIQLSSTSAPPRITYTVTLTYTGPTIGGEVDISFTDRLPDEMKNPGITRADRVSSCTFPDPPPATGGTFTCNTSFNEGTRSLTMEIGARPTGAVGTAVNTFEVSNGASTTWSTTILPPTAEPPPSTPTAPPAVSGPPAAATTTVADTFTTAGSTQPDSVTISPTAETVQVALTWPTGSSFDATDFTLTTPRTLAGVTQTAKLRVTKKRTARWLDVRIKGIHRGKLKFKIIAKKLHGRTRVVAKIRQSKR